MRPGIVPTTDTERELTEALEASNRKNEELERRMAVLRKSRDRVRLELKEEKKNSERLERKLNISSTLLQAKETECECQRGQLTEYREKCDNADTELDVSKRLITKLMDEAARMERVVDAFRNGSKFENLRKAYEGDTRKLHAQIRKLSSALAQADRVLVQMRKNWGGVFDDMLLEMNRERKDHDKAIVLKDKKIDSLQSQLERCREQLRSVRLKLKREKECAAELEDAVAKLERKVNMDQSNSGITTAGSELTANKRNDESETSGEAGKKKRKPNSRQKSDKKPGGQPGHKGHGRKRLAADTEVILPVPDEIGNSPDWVKTGKKKQRQIVGIKLVVYATDYVSEQYQNVHTGKLYSPPFPQEVPNDVNYADDLKAALLCLTHYCNVSNDKARLFLSDISGGALSVSHGFVDSLPRCFSKKSGRRKQEIFENLVKARSVHADFTVGKLNGKRVAIGICSDGKANVLFVMNHSKGHEAARLLPIKDAMVLITDREATFLNEYGIHHQICLEHLRRDLNDVLQNDPDRKWARQMLDLICTLWDKAKTWDKRRGLPKEERRAYEREFDEILNLAEKEYAKKPARKSLPQGPNLTAALRKLKKHVLYFLRHPWVPPDNSEAERMARLYKRKQHQCVTFRSDDGIISACDFLSIVTTSRLQGKNIFDEILAIFGEPMPTPANAEAV